MKFLKALRRPIIPLFFLTTCHGVWNFYPDTDNPGLSRFTSRGYGIASCYIKGKAYVNNGTVYPLLRKDSGANSVDTVRFTWPIWSHDTSQIFGAYGNIAFLFSVPRSFGKTNFLAFNGMRFENSVPMVITDTAQEMHSGTASLYFVNVVEEQDPNSGRKYIKMSGLFDGTIKDSISISKGRFDFKVEESELNF